MSEALFADGGPRTGDILPHRIDARRRRSAPVVASALAFVLLTASVATAAEFVEAELDGEVNRVEVEQGGSATFSIQVKATGTIRCSATPANPANARLNTRYEIDASGLITSHTPSAPAPFYGTGSGTCSVTWPGDPVWQTVEATVSADVDAPLGDRVVRLRPTLSTPPGSGATLRDDTPTLLTFTVVPGSDREPPALRCDGPHGSTGANGWRLEAVRYDCTAEDDGSGLADDADASFSLWTDGEGVRHTGWRTVGDRAGNVARVGGFGPFEVDLHDPNVTVESPNHEASYLLGSSVDASYGCLDTPDGSGVARCDGSVDNGAPLETSTVGWHDLAVTSDDHAGRDTDLSLRYHVVYGGSDPWVNGNAASHKAGSTVVVRWSLSGVGDLDSLVQARASAAPCDAAGAVPDAAPTGHNLRYDEQTDAFALNWRTDRSWAGGCAQLQLWLDDDTVRLLTVQMS